MRWSGMLRLPQPTQDSEEEWILGLRRHRYAQDGDRSMNPEHIEELVASLTIEEKVAVLTGRDLWATVPLADWSAQHGGVRRPDRGSWRDLGRP